MMNQKRDTVNLRDFLTVIFKCKSKIVTIFLATVITVTVCSFLMTPTYEAKSSLLVKLGREYIYRPEVGDRSPMVAINQQDFDETVNSEINILTSQNLIEKVITAIKIENIYPEMLEDSLLENIGLSIKMPPLQKAVLAFKKKLVVAGTKDKSNVIEVSFQHKDARIAASAVNMLVDFYEEKHIEVFSNPQVSFLEKQLAAYNQKLKQSEQEVEIFKQKNQVFSVDQQMSLLLKQRMDLDTGLKNLTTYTDELRKRRSSLKSRMDELSSDKDRYTPTERDKIIVDARAKLLDLKLKEQQLIEKYKESNRLIVNVRKEIGLVSDFLKQQEEDITGKVKTGNTVYQEAENNLFNTETELRAQIAKESTVRLQFSQVDREIQSLNLKEKELADLEREVSNNDKTYRIYVDKLEEARISGNMDRQKMSNVSVIQAATVPAKPIKPKKGLNIFLGIILGMVSGFGYAFFSEYISQSISTPEIAEKRLGLPVLTTVAFKK